jgi:transcriptional regulator with XRE-family HTH domain
MTRTQTGDGTVVSVGQRIREIRSMHGLTLSSLAAATGLSTGLISQVERGVSDPSLETLRRISKVLAVPIFSLFADDAAGAVAVVRKTRRMRVQSPGHEITYSRISPGRGKLEVLHGVLKPHSESAAEPWSHPSEECVVVLRGTLVVEVSGESYELLEGDSCYFDSNLPHRYRNARSKTAEFLISVTPPSF